MDKKWEENAKYKHTVYIKSREYLFQLFITEIINYIGRGSLSLVVLTLIILFGKQYENSIVRQRGAISTMCRRHCGKIISGVAKLAERRYLWDRRYRHWRQRRLTITPFEP